MWKIILICQNVRIVQTFFPCGFVCLAAIDTDNEVMKNKDVVLYHRYNNKTF